MPTRSYLHVYDRRQDVQDESQLPSRVRPWREKEKAGRPHEDIRIVQMWTKSGAYHFGKFGFTKILAQVVAALFVPGGSHLSDEEGSGEVVELEDGQSLKNLFAWAWQRLETTTKGITSLVVWLKNKGAI